MRVPVLLLAGLWLACADSAHAQLRPVSRHTEDLGRGVVAICPEPGKTVISWRLLASDPAGIAFNVYRIADGTKKKITAAPLKNATFVTDQPGVGVFSYQVEGVSGVKKIAPARTLLPVDASIAKPYISVPLSIPPVLDNNTYSANDASVADLNGDGEYEIILKWEPSSVRNPPQTGVTGQQIIDAYKLDGTRLWRINLGKNIRAGAAYCQFMVYDFDGDGKAEMICKTADGSVDGNGKMIGDATKDWRTLGDQKSAFYGKVVDGPEYLTVFDGETGAALATEPYTPTRYPLDGWGGIGGNGGNDNTGGRPDRFTACVAYLDGRLPSAVMVRGWYGRTVLSAWDFRKGKLVQRWIFDSKDATNPYSGMANHNLTVADVDNDGKDEICVGAMTVDDNGKGLYTTGLRHGDAIHLTDMDPSVPGLEVYGIHESEEKTLALNTPGVAMYSAATGKILWSLFPGVDVGRGVAADIDPVHPGFENWGGPGGLRDVKGNEITPKKPSSENFLAWWDGDLTRELLDKNRIDKWDWKAETTVNLLTAQGCVSNNGTKSTPCLSGDLFGDWREEAMWRTADSKELRIYTTPIATQYRFISLMQDPEYRLAIAWQNTSYNQPPHTGFYFGEGMDLKKHSKR